jgi:hypothetical protein
MVDLTDQNLTPKKAISEPSNTIVTITHQINIQWNYQLNDQNCILIIDDVSYAKCMYIAIISTLRIVST